MDIKKWLSETAHRPVYDQDVANILEVTRKTANKRINSQLEASDLIKLCRGLEINPVIALVELGYITDEEVAGYLDSDGQLIATAEDGDLALELARRLNPATISPEIDELAARRAANNTPVVPADPYADGAMPEDAVADSSEEVGGTPDDFDQ